MYGLTQKLDNIRRNIKGQAKSFFGDLLKIKGEVEEKLKKLQGEIAEGNNLESATQEEEEYRKKMEGYYFERGNILETKIKGPMVN